MSEVYQLSMLLRNSETNLEEATEQTSVLFELFISRPRAHIYLSV